MSSDVATAFTGFEWLLRDWQYEKQGESCRSLEVLVDPLNRRSGTKAVKDESSINVPEEADFADPLGATAPESAGNKFKIETMQKLHQKNESEGSVLMNTLDTENPECFVSETELPEFTSWSVKRKAILEKFEASEKLSITNSFFLNGIPFETQVSTLDRLEQRVQQFEDNLGRKHYANLSQLEYIRVMNELRLKLLLSWTEGKRIESLEIVVELANLLSATLSPSFYPSQFVLVTDILDIFGKLVYDRLLTMTNTERKAKGYEELLKDEFTTVEIPDRVQTVAKNWFYKLATIKELLPRFYVETALIGCMRFFDDEAITANVIRLCEMPNYMRHWLSSAYARAYVCRVVMRLKPICHESLFKCLNDWIFLSSTVPQTELLAPALEWIIQCASYGADSYEDMLPLWNFCHLSEKRSLLLEPFVLSVSNTYIFKHARQFCKLVLQDKDSFAKELTVFGTRLIDGEIDEDSRVIILKNVLPFISKIEDIKEYVECAVVWCSFAAKYFPLKTVDDMLNELVSKLSNSRQCELFSRDIARLIEYLVKSGKTVIELFSTESFIKLQDFVVDTTSMSCCLQKILSAFIVQRSVSSCGNFSIAYQILSLCTKLIDSFPIDAEEDDDIDNVLDLVKRSLDRFSLEQEPERALNFYVDMRAALSTNVNMTFYVVCRICNLGFNLIQVGHMSGMGASFLRACIANAFITIASIGDPKQRLHLYIQCGLLGLMANSLPQVDAITKCCVELLAECNEISAVDYRFMASTFLSFLIIVPDILKKRPLYIFDAFINAISRYNWNENWLEYGRLLMQCLNYLSVMRLDVFPYHLDAIESNDRLYGHDDKFTAVITEKESLILSHLVEAISAAEAQLPQLSMELLEMIASIGAVEAMVTVIYQLWQNVVGLKNFSCRRCAVYNVLKTQFSDCRKSKRLVKAINEMEQS
uniref:UPF0505 protein CG8202 n=1 Tax=Syphacia muris TaxID=451379 RepID=A0A0N5ADG4_9BILA